MIVWLVRTVKVKVKLSLCLTKHHAMEAYWGMEVELHAFFDLDIKLEVGSQLQALAALPPPPPRERASVTHWIGGLVGPRAVLDVVVKRKIPSPAGNRTTDHPARSPALDHWAITCPIIKKDYESNCSSYRRIQLLPTTYKNVSDIPISRLPPYTGGIIGDRCNSKTTDQIFCMRPQQRKK
jgi:hypothetical protein